MKRKNGFTLIELLAVIVILAVIALIATPLIMNVINDAKKGSAKDSAYAIIKAGELNVARNKLSAPITFTEADDLEYKGTKAEKMKLEFDAKGKGKLQLFINGTCIYKEYDEKEVRIDQTKTSPDTCVTGGVVSNVVVDMKDGLIPVTYDVSGNTVKADKNTAWYDYDKKQWANAVSVTSASRNGYVSASAGTVIKENDILGYFVYIPRYRYQLWNAENESKPEQEIKIEFEQKSENKSIGTKNGEWLTHPAFTFGTTELNGIWVGKFELTGTSANPTTKPNSVSLTNQNVFTTFNTIKQFQTNPEYGLFSYDVHMMKNMDWGATAYLSHSKYGKCTDGTCTEVWMNNTQTGPSNSPSITGCSGTSVFAEAKYNMTACELNWNYNKNGVNASTTGNIYGIYDMAGGAFESVMASTTDASGNFIAGSSGFTTTPDTKYWDRYGYSAPYSDDYGYSVSKLGDALREARKGEYDTYQGWYDDYSYIPNSSYPWFNRGGSANMTMFGGIFSDGDTDGIANPSNGSRAVMVDAS